MPILGYVTSRLLAEDAHHTQMPVDTSTVKYTCVIYMHQEIYTVTHVQTGNIHVITHY